MEKKTVITPEQLNNMPKDVLITMYLQLNDTLKSLTAQLEILTKQNASLEEKLAVLLTQQRYGRKNGKDFDL